MRELDREEEEYIEEDIDDKDGCIEEIEVINEDDEDSSHRQSSVVMALAKYQKSIKIEPISESIPVDDKEGIDSKLEVEDEIKDDDIDCDDEEIERLDDCSELVET